MERISKLEQEYVNEVLKNAFQTSKNSIYNNKLETAFSQLFGSKFAIGHINGTATLHTALAALDVKAGDEVIVPPLTMSSTALAVLQNNSIPVFADVDINTFNIDPKSIIEKITEKTKAIITVALYGLSPEYDEILEICKNNDIALIEDNAECFLSTYRDKYVGVFGDFASFSFQASKHLTAGEGGMLLCNDENLANNARRFSSLGYAGVSAKQGKITREDIQDPNYSRHISVGFNYRMSELCAAVVLGQLERANELVEVRMKTAEIYKEAIKGSHLVTLQHTPDYCINSYWSFSMILNTDNPEIDWYSFRKLHKANGGDGYYAAWKLSYFEPLFLENIQNMKGVWQKYEKGLCPVSEFLQPRMIQLKTNYWDLDDAKKQADILHQTINQFK
ncbi:DegT/DnrJ/EryC1/StrS family aminotransferase [Daejeonella sp. H1SJ63]|uniref:DegT/DnrJ/EryC1/StrS family aminotransferase n=1 Tax=Daejeonella sp. H1SJ63 TaxID=3034145 RepID=UPI0023EB678C|nr:DegT/DnrJ/EryC1/StrS family aminotransferase [Daejeonella sp. H1SJ63]